ncbi:MAG: MFS transporter [Marmoricola sp.]|nr:MFS transporter [Marmoricola sp.]
MLMATINSSIVIISLPAIFRGIHLNPLEPGNVSYLLWIIMGFLVVSAVLVVTLGRLGDMYGRVKMYNLGFLVFSVFSVLLSVDPFSGGNGAMWLIVMRIGQGIGGAMLFANSTAILTDAFPAHQRGMALGINQVSAIAGSFLGLVIGGLLAEWDWRAVFWVSVPIGVIGTVWGYHSLVELGEHRRAKLDLPGNLTFAVGLTALLVGITYGIQPYGSHSTGWTNPWVLAGIIGGAALLAVFVVIEQHVQHPMLSIDLFKIRAFSMGNLAGLLASVGRGGLQFMLIIWLQGIWLPLHGFDYESTPLWAGIYMLPLTVGFLIAGPASGWLSDRFGVRLFATGGLLVVAASFVGLLMIPVDFSYWLFALILFVNGVGSGLFTAPNTSAIMSSVPPHERGAASGIRGTVFNSGTSLSIGVFFSLMIVGLAGVLPQTLTGGLVSRGVPHHVAEQIGNLPPVGSLFASFLGYNPVASLLGPTGVLHSLPHADAAVLTGKQFFPHLMSGPFHHGLVVVFGTAAAMSVIGAVASWLAGSGEDGEDAAPSPELSPALSPALSTDAAGEALGRE